jgi:hypothetical protein
VVKDRVSVVHQEFVYQVREDDVVNIIDSQTELDTLKQSPTSTPGSPLPVFGSGRFALRNTLQWVVDRNVPFSFALTPISEQELPPCEDGKCAAGQVCSGTSGFCVEDTLAYSHGVNAPRTELAAIAWRRWRYSTPHPLASVEPDHIWCAGPNTPFTGLGPLSGSDLMDLRPTTLVSGDLPCVNDPPGSPGPGITKYVTMAAGPFPYASRKDVDAVTQLVTGLKPTPLTTSKLWETCLTELRRRPASSGNPDDVNTKDSLDWADFKNGLLDFPAACVNIGAFAKLEEMPGQIEQSTLSPDTKARLLKSAQLLSIRAGQEWLKLHSFVARQGLEQRNLSRVLPRLSEGVVDQTTTPVTVSTTELMNLMETGLTVVLHSRDLMLGAFTHAAQPDYRRHFTQGLCTNDADCRSPSLVCRLSQGFNRCVVSDSLPKTDDAQNGVAPAILDALTAYLLVVEADLEEAARVAYSGVPGKPSAEARKAVSRAGTAMRFALFGEQSAKKIFENGIECITEPTNGAVLCKDPSWGEAWRKGLEELSVAQRRVAALLQTVARGENPLGIAEDDTPIFFGDTAGTNSRYFAGSDYLLSGWADPAVKSAQAALAAAREDWKGMRDREVGAEQRLDDTAMRYGTELLENCGPVQIKGEPVAARDVIEAFHTNKINPRLCFLVQGGQCPADLKVETVIKFGGGDVTTDGARAELCRIDYLRRAGAVPINPGHPLRCFMAPGSVELCSICAPTDADCKARCVNDCGAQCGNNHRDVRCENSCVGAFKKEYCEEKSAPCVKTAGNLSEETCPSSGQSADTDAQRKECFKRATDAVGPTGRYPQNGTQESTVWPMATVADGIISAGMNCTAPVTALYDDPTLRSHPRWRDADAFCSKRLFFDPLTKFNIPNGCLQGRLGDAMKNIQIAKVDAEDAYNALKTHAENMVQQIDLCKKQAMGDAAVLQALEAYRATKRDWMKAGMVLSGFSALVRAGVSGGASLAEDGIPLFQQTAQLAIDDAEGHYQTLAQKNEFQQKALNCKFEVDRLQRGMSALNLRIKRQAIVVDAEVLKFRNLQESNILAFSTGRSAMEREKIRTGPNFAYHFWYQEKVDRFKREMEWSRRLVFLAMRAVEYELQQSLPLRAKILSAAHPDELETAVRMLQQEQGSRAINRRRPEESSLVVSLRDDVLEIQDHSSLTNGERNWTPAMRFRGRLWDSRYAVRAENGDYLGQGIPFSLKETGILENRCGERLWRVTATVQGDGLSALEPGTPLQLLKRNTFMSQYCEGKGDGKSKYQVNSIRPSSELLKGEAGRSEEISGFTAAVLYPWFNVRRFDFFDVQYRKGASEELAGRALYGDYVLLFPKQILEKSPLRPEKATFPLENVEDVLLRIDYLSVDNLPVVRSTERGADTPDGKPSAMSGLVAQP